MPDRRLPTTRFNLSVRHVVSDSTIYGGLVTRVTWCYGSITSSLLDVQGESDRETGNS